MKTNFPIKNQIWTPSYIGEYWGDFVRAFRINLYRDRGNIRFNYGLGIHTSNQDNSALIYRVSAFIYFDGYYWAFAKKVLKTEDLWNKFEVDTLANSPTDLNDADAVIYQDKLIVSRPTDLAMLTSSSGTWDATWWTGTLGQPALQNCSHPLATMGSAHLFVGDKNNMHDIFGGDTVYLNRYTIPDENAEIEWIRTTSDFVYIGVNFEGKDKYMVVEFDPISEKSKEIFLDQKAMGFVWNDVFYLILEDGSLKVRSGSYATTPLFEKIAQFPAYYGSKQPFRLPHRNGIAIYRGRPIFLVKETDDKVTGLGGIYVFDKEVGIYHWDTVGNDKSYGFPILHYAGALYVYENNAILASAEVYSTNLNSLKGIFCNWYSEKPEKFSWIELPEITTTELDELWQNIAIFGRKLWGTDANPKVTVQYRVKKPDAMPYSGKGTWNSENSFSYTLYTDATANDLAVGNTVMIMEGDGAGLIAHITDVDTENKIITIDKSVSGASGDLYFYLDGYKKVGTVTLENSYKILSFPQPLISPWLQVRLIIEQYPITAVSIQHKPNNILE